MNFRRIDLTRCITAMVLLTPTLGFVAPRQNRALCATRCFAKAGNQPGSPKRRFSQDVHNVPPENRRPTKPQPKPTNEREIQHERGETDTNFVSQRTRRPPPPRTNNSKSGGKSIEELESIMERKFGSQKWSADPSEYVRNYNPQHKKNGVFRGKPVIDPWQKEERQNTVGQKGDTGGFFGSQDDAMLNRVRKNQERLKTKTGSSSNEETNIFEDGDDVAEDEIALDLEVIDEEADGSYNSDWETEFLDEDDVYEMEGVISDDDIQTPQKNPSPGFFFNEAAAKEEPKEVAPPESEAMKKPKRKKKKKRAGPVMGRDGNPLYLTLEQAERNFESILETNDDGDDADYTPPTTRSWEELGITSEQLLANLEDMECSAPLSVQDKACTPVLSDKDVLVGTYTGSGKTLAFLVPMIQRLLDGDGGKEVQALIVAPGRELASQIVSVARSLLEGTDLSVMLAIGGTTFGRNLEQIRKRKPSIIVGTPGRIAELVVGRPGEKSGRLKIGSLRTLVMDEFDALLEYKPHRDPTNAILQTLKRRHSDTLQSILCSATASDMINSPKLQNFLRPGYVQAMADQDDQLITTGTETSAKDASTVTRVSRTVIHGVVNVPHRRLALDTLRRILHTEPMPQQVLVFADTSHRVEILIDKLADMGIIAAPLHGGRGSEKVDRAEVSKALREGYVGIVVATEMAARGLDAPLLTHVINLDLPTDASHYAHRAGRCGRGGRPGVVINFTTSPKERKVPQRFADKLGIDMCAVEPRSGKLLIVEPDSNDEL